MGINILTLHCFFNIVGNVYIRCFPGRRRGKQWLQIKTVLDFSDVAYSNLPEEPKEKILSSEAHDSVVYGWHRNLREVRTVFQIHPIPSSRSFSPWPLDKRAPVSTYQFPRLTSLNSGCIWLNNCVAKCRCVPVMSREFHFWQRQTHRVTRLWLVNPRLPAMSPQANGTGTCHNDNGGGEGLGKSPIWCIQGWPSLRHYTDRWPTTRRRALLLTALNFIQFHVKHVF